MAEITTDTENMFSSTEGIGDAYNMSLNTSAPDDSCGTQYLVDKLFVKLLFVVLYFIIFCLGFFGNILVITVVIRNASMHSVTNFFILNLAISDVIMCMVAVPFTPLMSFADSFFAEYLANDISCKLPPFAMGVSVYISTLTMTIIALDRYVVILYPFRARMQIKTCAVLVAVINLLSMAFTAPYVHIMDSVEVEPGITQCQETWQGTPRTIYGIFTNITQFVIPFITIIVCYAAVIQRLNRRSSERPGGARSASREAMERARTKRTNRMLIYMVIVFGVCWLPLNSMNFLADLNSQIYCWEYYYFSFFVAHVFAMSSTCANPFLYGWYNESFQKEFVSLIPALKCICVRKESGDKDTADPTIKMVTHVTHDNGRNANSQITQHTIKVTEQTTIANNKGHMNHNNDGVQKPVCAVSPIKQTPEHAERSNEIAALDSSALPLLAETNLKQNITIMKEISATETGRNYTCITNSKTKDTEGTSNVASFV